MIVKNEEANLRACLEPLRGLVDEMIVVDTGSIDRTREIAEELGARVIDHRWDDDFSAARNTGLQHCTSDWIFWLDADDRVQGENLRRFAQLRETLPADGLHGYIMACECPGAHPAEPGSTIPQVRLFRRHPEAHWHYRVHEQLLPNLEKLAYKIHTTPIQITHLGYLDPALRQRKAQRNLRLLRLEYLANPDDPVVLHFLGMTYLDMGEPKQALNYLYDALKIARTNGDWLRNHYLYITQALAQLGYLEQAYATTNEGLNVFPADQRLLFEQAELLAKKGDIAGVERALLQLLRTPVEVSLRMGMTDSVMRREARRLLGVVYMDCGRMLESERILQELLAEHPTYVQGWVSLCYVYLNTRQMGRFDFAVRQAEKCPGGEVFAQILQAEAALGMNDFETATSTLDRAIAKAPRMLWPRLVRVELLQKGNAPIEDRLAACRDVLRLDPSNQHAANQVRFLEQCGHPQGNDLASIFSSTIHVGPGGAN